MSLYKYQYYVLQNLQISKSLIPNVHKTSTISHISLQLSPLVLKKTTLLACTLLSYIFTSKTPTALSKVNKRTKEKNLSGFCITIRKSKALQFLQFLRFFSFYHSPNFSGLLQQKHVNSTLSLRLTHLSFSRPVYRVFELGLFELEDELLVSFIQLFFKHPTHFCLAVPRALKIPIKSD